MAVIKDLSATHNLKVDPPLLTVHGEIEVVDPAAVTTVAKADPQGIDPTTLLLNLSADPPGGKGAFVSFHYEVTAAQGQFSRVQVTYDDGSETVDIHTLG